MITIRLLGILALVALFVFGFGSLVLADSTIGTNMSTTGTFTQTVGSATAARFQNAAGTTTVLQVDTTNTRVGVGAAPGTTFEAQGTASASYFLTGNTIQVGGFASVAYSRFGTAATSHAGSITTTNDLLISGDFEVNGSVAFDGFVLFGSNASIAGNFELTGGSGALFGINAGAVIDTTLEIGGTASISGVITLADGQIRPLSNAATAFRFQNAAGTTNVLVVDTTNARVGIGTTPATTFEAQGTASASYFLTGNTIQVGGFASVAYSRFGTAATTHAGSLTTTNDVLVSGDFEVDGSAAFDGFVLFGSNASIAGNFETGGAATSSAVFDSTSSTKGACLELKDQDGSGYTYLRVNNGTGTFSTVSCK